MNIENHLSMRMYQLLLVIRDSVEYALLDVEYQPHIFYLRKSMMEQALNEGVFAEMLKSIENKDSKIYNNLEKLYKDIYVNSRYLKVEDDKISRFDDNNIDLLESLVGNYFVVASILEYNLKTFKEVSDNIRSLVESDKEYFTVLYSYVLLVNLLQQKTLSLTTKDDKGFTSLISLFYFFKEKAKPKDEEISNIIESVNQTINQFLIEKSDADLVKHITELYEVLDAVLKEKEEKWQKEYESVINFIKAENN